LLGFYCINIKEFTKRIYGINNKQFTERIYCSNYKEFTERNKHKNPATNHKHNLSRKTPKSGEKPNQ
jgi:hypothetical protein